MNQRRDKLSAMSFFQDIIVLSWRKPPALFLSMPDYSAALYKKVRAVI